MPVIVESYKKACKVAGLECEPHKVQVAAGEGRVPHVRKVRHPAILWDVEPGREIEFEAWLEDNIERVARFSLFDPDRENVLPRLPADRAA